MLEVWIDGNTKGCSMDIELLDIGENKWFNKPRTVLEGKWEGLLLTLEFLSQKGWFDNSIILYINSKRMAKWYEKAPKTANLHAYYGVCIVLWREFEDIKMKYRYARKV